MVDFKCWGNHMGWITAQYLDDDGAVIGVTTWESAANGQVPSLINPDRQIKILRVHATDEEAKRAVVEAAKIGYRRYDFLLPWALIQRYGFLKPKVKGTQAILPMLAVRLLGYRVQTPHVRDGRDVCIEFVQEPWADVGKPLIEEKWLLTPDVTGSKEWDVIFESFPGWTLNDLPMLRPGDIFISRAGGNISALIRWWFSGRQVQTVPVLINEPCRTCT